MKFVLFFSFPKNDVNLQQKKTKTFFTKTEKSGSQVLKKREWSLYFFFSSKKWCQLTTKKKKNHEPSWRTSVFYNSCRKWRRASKRAIALELSQSKSTREIHSSWDRTRQNYAVMRMSDIEASGQQSVARSLSRAAHILSRSQRQLALGKQL